MTETITKKCRQYSIPRSTYYWRISQGWSEKNALTIPPATKHDHRIKPEYIHKYKRSDNHDA
jgi:hypothetical protein